MTHAIRARNVKSKDYVKVNNSPILPINKSTEKYPIRGIPTVQTKNMLDMQSIIYLLTVMRDLQHHLLTVEE